MDKQKQAEEWILAEHTAGREPTIQQTRAGVGCGVDTVRRARRALRAEGLVADVRPHTPSRFSGKSFEEVSAALSRASAGSGDKPEKVDKWLQVVEQVLAGQGRILTDTERKQLLSGYALIAGPLVGGGLLEKLHKIEAASGQTDRYTPPAPLSVEEAAMRLSRLLAAYGPEVGELAWNMAFAEEADGTHEPVSGGSEVQEGDARVGQGGTPQRLEEGEDGPTREEGPEASPGDSFFGAAAR